MNYQEAVALWAKDRPHFESKGVILQAGQMYIPDGWKHNWKLAVDAQPTLTTDPNSGIPAFLTTLVDPDVYRILWSPNKAAEIFGEEKKGSWVDQTAMFPVIEHTGEVNSYGDYNESGSTGANTNFPQRQNYLFQTFVEYGDLESERAGLARINWVSEQNSAASLVLNKYSNLIYFYGVAGLQNYGLLNDPNLSAALTPSTKVAGGTKWINNGVIVATANEIYLDIESIFIKLITQTGGLIDRNAAMVLAMSPTSETALTATNSFAVNVSDLLKKNFPNMTVKTAVQYGALSSSNPQGNAAGELVQLIVGSVEGQKTGYCSFSEKLRTFPLVRQSSSWRQKQMAGAWGAVIRGAMGIASMVGV